MTEPIDQTTKDLIEKGAVGNFHFQKGYKGDCKVIMGMNQLF